MFKTTTVTTAMAGICLMLTHQVDSVNLQSGDGSDCDCDCDIDYDNSCCKRGGNNVNLEINF